MQKCLPHAHCITLSHEDLFFASFWTTDSQKAEAWNRKSDRSIDTLGDEDQKDWKSVWICCCIVLYVSSLGLLAEYIHQVTVASVLEPISKPFCLQCLYQHLPNGTWGEFSLSRGTISWKEWIQQVLRGIDDPTGMRKEVKNQESALSLQSVWNFEGYLKFSPIFYGYYSNEESTDIGMFKRRSSSANIWIAYET